MGFIVCACDSLEAKPKTSAPTVAMLEEMAMKHALLRSGESHPRGKRNYRRNGATILPEAALFDAERRKSQFGASVLSHCKHYKGFHSLLCQWHKTHDDAAVQPSNADRPVRVSERLQADTGLENPRLNPSAASFHGRGPQKTQFRTIVRQSDSREWPVPPTLHLLYYLRYCLLEKEEFCD